MKLYTIKNFRSDYSADWASYEHPEASEAIVEVTKQLNVLFLSQFAIQDTNSRNAFKKLISETFP